MTKRSSIALLVSLVCALLVAQASARAIVGSPVRYLPLVTLAEGVTPQPRPPAPPLPVVQVPFLTNGNFDLGDTAWTEFAGSRRLLIRTDKLQVAPKSGRYVAKLGGVANEASFIVQRFEFARASRELTFVYQTRSTAPSGTNVGVVSINGVAVRTFDLSADAQTTDWEEVRLDISQYAGKKVTLSFQARTDAAAAEWYLDNVRVP